MSEINPLNSSDKLEELQVRKYNWDLEIKGTPYQIVKVENKIHSIGGHFGDNDLYCYKLDIEVPVASDLIEYGGHAPLWGFHISESNYIKTKWGDTECRGTIYGQILRNEKPFYGCGSNDIAHLCAKLQVLLGQASEHPANVSERDWEKKLIGRKVWYENQPAIVDRHIELCDFYLLPENPNGFVMAKHWDKSEIDYDYTMGVKTDIFDPNIYWFRKDSL